MKEAIEKLRNDYKKRAQFADWEYAAAYREFAERLTKILEDAA